MMSSLRIALDWTLRRNQIQFWPPERWQHWQAERLAEVLRFAWDRIPYYRHRWTQPDVGMVDAPSADDLDRVPILSREDVRQHARELAALHVRRLGWRMAYSSGSTGPRVGVWRDLTSQVLENLARMRQRRACGLGWGAREAWLAGPQVYSGLARRGTLRQFLTRNRFFVPVGDEVRSQWERLCMLRPQAIQGFPGAIQALTEVDRLASGNLPSLRVVFTTGEVLTNQARRQIERSLCVPVRDIYGSAELGDVAWQCSTGEGYHINSDVFYVEVLGAGVHPGAAGRVLVTSLHSRAMPLVRYDLGDWAVPTEGACGCGRTLPLLKSIAGRSLDVLVMPSGRRVAPYPLLDRVVFPFLLRHEHSVRRFQIVQAARDEVTINLVAAGELPQPELEALRRDAAHALPESLDVRVSLVSELEADPSGKVKRLLSKVDLSLSEGDPELSDKGSA